MSTSNRTRNTAPTRNSQNTDSAQTAAPEAPQLNQDQKQNVDLWNKLGAPFIHAMIVACIFFTPHANTRIFGSAYSLGYQSVNISTLYIGMGMLASGWWSWKQVSYRWKIALGTFLGALGCLLMAVTYWVEGSARTGLFWAAQVFISIDFSIATIILFEAVFTLSLLKKEDLHNTFQTRKQRLFIGFATSYIPLAYLMAQFISQSMMRQNDTYFMFQNQAIGKICILYFVYMFLNLCSKLLIFLMPSRLTVEQEQSKKYDCSLWKNWTAWVGAYPPAFFSTMMIYSLAQWEYLQNQFPGFMFSESKVMACYMMIGAAWASASFTLQLFTTCYSMTCGALYLGVQASMLVCFYYYPSTALISFFAFLIGFLIQTLYLNALVDMQTIRTKLENDRTGLIYTFMGSISGLIACALMAMFESFYYSNRDVLYWVTINNSAVPGTLAILGLVTTLCLRCKIKRM